MNYIFAAFKSQNDAATAFSLLNAMSVPCSIISTPRTTGLGCGLSVRFPVDYKENASMLKKLHTFSGLYYVTILSGKSIVTPLNT